jgi:hypothetical protein
MSELTVLADNIFYSVSVAKRLDQELYDRYLALDTTDYQDAKYYESDSNIKHYKNLAGAFFTEYLTTEKDALALLKKCVFKAGLKEYLKALSELEKSSSNKVLDLIEKKKHRAFNAKTNSELKTQARKCESVNEVKAIIALVKSRMEENFGEYAEQIFILPTDDNQKADFKKKLPEFLSFGKFGVRVTHSVWGECPHFFEII